MNFDGLDRMNRRFADAHPGSFSEFHRRALDTWKPSGDIRADIDHCTYGLVEEAGEVAGKMKRRLRGDFGGDAEAYRTAVLHECGDVLWYLDILVSLLGSDLGTVGEATLDRLADRKARGVLKGAGDDR